MTTERRVGLTLFMVGMAATVVAAVFLIRWQVEPATPRARNDVETGSPRQLTNGQYLLPNGWCISPAGRQSELGGLPLKLVGVPGSDYILVMSSGYTAPFVGVLDAVREEVVQKVPIADGWLGLAVSADGRHVYASAGGKDAILVYNFEAGTLTAAEPIPLPAKSFPAGITLNRAGTRLYVAANLGDALHVVDVVGHKVTATIPVGPKPYTTVVTQDERTAYVSNWGEDSVAVVDLANSKVQHTIKVQDHPNDLVLSGDGRVLYVANGNRNTVSVIDTAQPAVIEQIDVAVEPNSPPGSTPNALALSPTGKALLVANADNNAVAILDVSRPGHSQPSGFLPTGWYPTALCFTRDGKKLVVANGKGSISMPNRFLPPDSKLGSKQNTGGKPFDYVGRLLQGAVSFVDLPDERQLADYSRQVHQNAPLARRLASPMPAPFLLGRDCPIQHIIYIIKENRTYDCILGDIPEGNGDKEYCLFPEEITPNHHALARQFTLFDNFYHDAEVSADGHHWVTSAYATDYVEKFWPSMYAGRGRQRLDLHDDPVAYSKAGFLWDLCARAGLSYRSYGEFARIRGAKPGEVRAGTPSLEGHIHTTYFGADGIAAMSDRKRFELWHEDFQRLVAAKELPRFTVLSLPGDHLLGTRKGVQTPRAMMAENDMVLGKMVEAISKSAYWSKTAIFVVEDDTQDGPDHVDCHRTVALVISPYTKRRFVDHTMYSTSSMLRTMELILGLPPLTQYDAAAMPMWPAFQEKADATPYAALPARVPLDEKNLASAPGANRSEELTLNEADTAPDAEYNAIIWKAVKGADAVLPPRRVAAFVRERPSGDDDEVELPDKDATVRIPAQEWPLRPGPRNIKVAVHYPGGSLKNVNASTGIMLTLHNWGGEGCVGTADPKALAQRYNVIGLCVDYLQSGKKASIDDPEPYDFGYLQALDALRALHFVFDGLVDRKQPFARERIFATGGSGGGNVTLMANKLAPRTFAVTIDLCGMAKLSDDIAYNLPGGSDLDARYSRDAKNPFYLSPDAQQLRFVGHPDHLKVMKQLETACKIVVVHGAEDRTCPTEDAREMVANLKAAGLDVEAHFITKEQVDGRVFTSTGHSLGNRTEIVFRVADKYLLPNGPQARVRKGPTDFERKDTRVRYATPNGTFVISFEKGYPVGKFDAGKP